MEEGMKAIVDLLDNSKIYVVKDGKLIEHELPEFGETVITSHQGKVAEIKTTTKKRI